MKKKGEKEGYSKEGAAALAILAKKLALLLVKGRKNK